MKLGEHIDLIVEAIAGAKFEGHVSAIAPAADLQSRVFDVEVTIPNPNGRLRPGMIGTVALRPASAEIVDASRSLPTVPLTAIVRSASGEEQYGAFTVERQGEGYVARMRPVRLGEVMGNGVAVKSGVASGDRIVITGANLLVDGDPIRVIP